MAEEKQKIPDPIRRKLRRWLTYMAIFISVISIVTFTLFIYEESLQVAMFGTWPAQDAGDWAQVLRGLDLMESLNLQMKIITYSVGWVNPLALFSYRAYARSTDYYIASVKSKCFARAPEVFDGREIDFAWRPHRVEQLKDGRWKSVNRKINVFTMERLNVQQTYQLRGKVMVENNLILITAESTKSN